MATLAEMRIKYPEFSGQSDAVVSAALGDAAQEISVSKWGVFYDRGQMALAAHFCFIYDSRQSGAVTGEIDSWSAEGNSVKFRTSTTVNKNTVVDTIYRREFDRLADKVGGRQERTGISTSTLIYNV
jgi:hypothetical protein